MLLDPGTIVLATGAGPDEVPADAVQPTVASTTPAVVSATTAA
jgi:hypothetical protein